MIPACELERPFPNFRPEQWRNEQNELFLSVLQAILHRYEPRLGERMSIFRTDEWYDASIEDAYFLPAEAKSDNIPIYSIIWNPLTKELFWSIVLVRTKGRGIGTALREMTEELAVMLGAKRLVCELILNEHLGYWKKQKGYVVDEVKHTAVFCLR